MPGHREYTDKVGISVKPYDSILLLYPTPPSMTPGRACDKRGRARRSNLEGGRLDSLVFLVFHLLSLRFTSLPLFLISRTAHGACCSVLRWPPPPAPIIATHFLRHHLLLYAFPKCIYSVQRLVSICAHLGASAFRPSVPRSRLAVPWQDAGAGNGECRTRGEHSVW